MSAVWFMLACVMAQLAALQANIGNKFGATVNVFTAVVCLVIAALEALK